MEDRLASLELDMMTLRSVTASLWANFIANGTTDPISTARRLSYEARDDIGLMLSNPPTADNPRYDETIHGIQDRLETFWQSVEQILERRTSPVGS